MTNYEAFNSATDLVLERWVDVAPHLVWEAWTNPEIIPHWFAPRPWTTAECQVDLRPGGIFRTVMRSPEGQLFPNDGCFLEVVPNRRLVWTDALKPGFRPSEAPFFTAILTFESVRGGTKYVAHAMHKDDADRQKHAEMGFLDGWGTCLDQLVETMKSR